MRRTQLYLDDDLWSALRRVRSRRTTISELAREAIRENYFSQRDQQAKAMQEFVGIGKHESQTAPDEGHFLLWLTVTRPSTQTNQLLTPAPSAIFLASAIKIETDV